MKVILWALLIGAVVFVVLLVAGLCRVTVREDEEEAYIEWLEKENQKKQGMIMDE